MNMQFGVYIPPDLADLTRGACQAEEQGFDIVSLSDSQNRAPEPFVLSGMVAAHTQRVRIRIGTANPVTRDAAVTGAGAATLQLASGDRAVLGLAGGYTALAYIGRSYPAPVTALEEYVRQVRCYLHGEVVLRNETESTLAWLPAGFTPPPVEVACTGPRTIRAAATTADWVTFGVGAAPERIGWAIETARAAQSTSPPAHPVQLGAQIAVAVTDDEAAGCDALRQLVLGMAQFSAPKGGSATPQLSAASRALTDAFAARQTTSGQDPSWRQGLASELSDEFVRWFAIVGGPAYVAGRIRQIHDLGLRHLFLNFGGGMELEQAAAAQFQHRFASEVIPLLAE